MIRAFMLAQQSNPFDVRQLTLEAFGFVTTRGLDLAVNIAAAIAIYLVGRIAVRILTGLLEKVMARAKVDITLAGFLSNIARYVLLTFVVLMSLQSLGVNTTSVAAVMGAAGLAVGLALQGSLANFACGVMIILFKPFRVGDFIEAAGV